MSIVQLIYFASVKDRSSSDFWLLEKGRLTHRSVSPRALLKQAGLTAFHSLPKTKVNEWPGHSTKALEVEPAAGLPVGIAMAIAWDGEEIAKNDAQLQYRFWVIQPDVGLILAACSTLTDAAKILEKMLRAQLPFEIV